MHIESISLGDFDVNEVTLRGSRDDEVWFKNHPRRVFRLRRILPDEYPAPASHVLCAHVEPGMIVRNSFVSQDDPPNTDMQGECLWQWWGNDPLSPKYGKIVAEIKRRTSDGNPTGEDRRASGEA